MPRFSIVVPAYNVGSYIDECLKSLENQTFGDFEVICVDDASPDNSAAIIQSYCDRDPRFRLIRNARNMHLFASRHIGVRDTTGEYVLFVDGDDKLVENALEKIDEQLRSNPVDILQFPMKPVADPEANVTITGKEWFSHKSEPKVLRGGEILGRICYEQAEDMCAHHRAIRGDLARDVLVELGFDPDIYSAEDITELIALMIAAESYQVIDSEPYYIYYVGRGLSEVRSTIAFDSFINESHAKRRCYDVLTKYLDCKGIQDAAIRTPIEWTWRHSCTQTLYLWQNSLPIDNRIAALEDFIELWPAAWVIPSLCTFVANEAMRLIDGEVVDPALLKRSFLLNVQCIGASFIHYNTNQAYADETISTWNDLRTGLDGQALLSNGAAHMNEETRFLLRCMRSFCLFLRNELWTIDDQATQMRFKLIEQTENADRAMSVLDSKPLRLAKKIYSPFRALRNTGSSKEKER